MPTRPLDRLMFAQGNKCFFCKKHLEKSEASVEHLLASSNGGTNHDDNCVACCKAINALLGSMSLKEKIGVVLNQKGDFKCPNGGGKPHKATGAKVKAPVGTPKAEAEKVSLVVKNLKQRKTAKPASLKTLKSTITSLFPDGISDEERDAIIQHLEASEKITVLGTKVSYSL